MKLMEVYKTKWRHRQLFIKANDSKATCKVLEVGVDIGDAVRKLLQFLRRRSNSSSPKNSEHINNEMTVTCEVRTAMGCSEKHY